MESETEIAKIKKDLEYIKKAVDLMQIKLDVVSDKYLLRDEFSERLDDLREYYNEKIRFLERIIYTTVGIIATSVLVAVINTVIKQ